MKKDPAENSVVDFVDDEEFYACKKSKNEIEYITTSIYIFATLALLMYCLALVINRDNFDWIDFAINIIIILIYYTLAVYSRYKPFTALIGVLCTLVFVFALQIIFSSELSFRNTLLRMIYVIYIAMKLEHAKRVQEYELRSKL